MGMENQYVDNSEKNVPYYFLVIFILAVIVC